MENLSIICRAKCSITRLESMDVCWGAVCCSRRTVTRAAGRFWAGCTRSHREEFAKNRAVLAPPGASPTAGGVQLQETDSWPAGAPDKPCSQGHPLKPPGHRPSLGTARITHAKTTKPTASFLPLDTRTEPVGSTRGPGQSRAWGRGGLRGAGTLADPAGHKGPFGSGTLTPMWYFRGM